MNTLHEVKWQHYPNNMKCIFSPISVIPHTPTLTVSPTDVTLETGTPVTLTCATISTGGTVTYDFLKDGTSVASQSSGTYTISNSSPADTGTYTCTVSINSVTSLTSSGHTTTVVGESLMNNCAVSYMYTH